MDNPNKEIKQDPKFVVLFILLLFPMLALVPGLPFLFNPNDYTGLGQVFFGLPLTLIGSISFWSLWWILYKKIDLKPFVKHSIFTVIIIFLLISAGVMFSII